MFSLGAKCIAQSFKSDSAGCLPGCLPACLGIIITHLHHLQGLLVGAAPLHTAEPVALTPSPEVTVS